MAKQQHPKSATATLSRQQQLLPKLTSSHLTIEQMYEDIPNTTYSSRSMITTKSAPAQNKSVVSSLIKAPGKGTGSSPSASDRQGSSVSLVEAGGKGSRNKMATNKKSPVTESLPRKSTSASSSRTFIRMTNATASSLYKDKLTAFEKTEIVDYQYVYYLGGESKKLADLELGKKSNFGCDDQEHFYRVVPRDHIAYRYEIAEKPYLGKGTFGQVIRAFDHKEQKWVALKLVRNEKIYLSQSREELKILQLLRKQNSSGLYNIVKLKDSFMFRNHMVFSFELLGMNLYQVLKRQQYRGLPISRILLIARCILKCLELLFKNRIIHCDIKPENIMLRKNGDLTSVKVGDFGSSCYEQQQKYHYIQSRYYRAPEVMLGMRYGPAIDMWSLGCVLGELANGHPIIVGEDEDDQLAAVKEALGDIPTALMNKSKSRNRGDLTVNGRGRPGSKPIFSKLGTDESFKDAVRKMLVIDPELRPTPMEMQNHPWIRSNRISFVDPSIQSNKSSISSGLSRKEGSSKGSVRISDYSVKDSPGTLIKKESSRSVTIKDKKLVGQGSPSVTTTPHGV